jgi:hypothetical protein
VAGSRSPPLAYFGRAGDSINVVVRAMPASVRWGIEPVRHAGIYNPAAAGQLGKVLLLKYRRDDQAGWAVRVGDPG